MTRNPANPGKALLIGFFVAASPVNGHGLAEPAEIPSGCADALKPGLDLESLAPRDESPSSGPSGGSEAEAERAEAAADMIERQADLIWLEMEAERAFKSAANALCATGQLDHQTFAPFSRLLIQSGSGATETAVYVDPDRPDTLIFQWIFVESDLAIPDQADIEMGIACWADPENQDCVDRIP